jgi:hypothetical protein
MVDTADGWYTSIAIGSDGNPAIAYYDSSPGHLKFANCSNISCTAAATSTLDRGGNVGTQVSLAIGTDGFPVMSYYDGTRGYLDLAKCNNISCSSYATSSLDQKSVTGEYTSIAIGTDGFPVISYLDLTSENLNFVKCNSISCVSAASTTLGNLTSTNADLSNYLDDAAYTNVASSDDIYDSLSAGTSTRLAYLFTRKNKNNTDTITVTWEGQVSRATTTYLKIYNSSSSLWEVLTSNSAPTANTDFTLTGFASTSLSKSLANYYDANNVAYFRVETGTTTA